MANSQFRLGSLDRRLLRIAKLERRLGVTDYDQKPWGLLYKALQDDLGIDPKNFQLVYPFTSWDWKTEQVGFISSVQYDFCSTTPQWSAVGDYASTGDHFHMAYQEFLDVIVAAADDPELREKIREADNLMTEASNEYTYTYNQARSAYDDDPDVVDNVPSFTEWLGSPAGKGWLSKIETVEVRLDQEQKNYNALVDQCNTPGLANAQEQFKNEDFRSKLADPGLSTFTKVPNWSISQNAQEWVDRVKAGKGPSGATVGFTNRDSEYDYKETWAQGSLAIKQLFWEVLIEGQWRQVKEFESDQQLEVSLQLEAVDQISIQPGNWYNGPFLKGTASGPYKKGYSAYGEETGTQAVFGEKGFMGLLKTGMYVCYKPAFTIRTSQSTFSSFLETFKAAAGLRIGPFQFGASGGITEAGWNYSEQGLSFTGTSDSETALILGITVAQLPNSG